MSSTGEVRKRKNDDATGIDRGVTQYEDHLKCLQREKAHTQKKRKEK